MDRVVLELEFNPNVFKTEQGESDMIDLKVYTINYNILRFMNGMAACAYT